MADDQEEPLSPSLARLASGRHLRKLHSMYFEYALKRDRSTDVAQQMETCLDQVYALISKAEDNGRVYDNTTEDVTWEPDVVEFFWTMGDILRRLDRSPGGDNGAGSNGDDNDPGGPCRTTGDQRPTSPSGSSEEGPFTPPELYRESGNLEMALNRADGVSPLGQGTPRPLVGPVPFRQESPRPLVVHVPFGQESPRPVGPVPFRQESPRPVGPVPFRQESPRPIGPVPFRQESPRPVVGPVPSVARMPSRLTRNNGSSQEKKHSRSSNRDKKKAPPVLQDDRKPPAKEWPMFSTHQNPVGDINGTNTMNLDSTAPRLQATQMLATRRQATQEESAHVASLANLSTQDMNATLELSPPNQTSPNERTSSAADGDTKPADREPVVQSKELAAAESGEKPAVAENDEKPAGKRGSNTGAIWRDTASTPHEINNNQCTFYFGAGHPKKKKGERCRRAKMKKDPIDPTKCFAHQPKRGTENSQGEA